VNNKYVWLLIRFLGHNVKVIKVKRYRWIWWTDKGFIPSRTFVAEVKKN